MTLKVMFFRWESFCMKFFWENIHFTSTLKKKETKYTENNLFMTIGIAQLSKILHTDRILFFLCFSNLLENA
jgi:hypothetical protein